MNKKTRGILLIALGMVLVLAGVGLHLLHEQQDALAGQNSAQLLNALAFEIQLNNSFLEDEPSPELFASPAISASPAESETLTPNEPPVVVVAPEPSEPAEPVTPPAMPIRTLAGYDLIGVLRVPSVNIELPVLNDWSYSLLNIAPCRYSGSLEQENLILLGHSYKTHFEPLEDAEVGDKVELIDVNGVVHCFVVDTIDIIHGTDTDLLASEHPLVIFTCTRDSSHRIVVRCSLLK